MCFALSKVVCVCVQYSYYVNREREKTSRANKTHARSLAYVQKECSRANRGRKKLCASIVRYL